MSRKLNRRRLVQAGTAAGAIALTGTHPAWIAAQEASPTPGEIVIPDNGVALPTDDITFRWIDSGDQKAVFYRAPGGIEVLEYANVPDPEPGALDVVVRVEACALNRLDAVQRHGWYQLPGFSYPHVAGMDVAGTIIAVGSDVTGVAVGERVVIDPSMAGVAEGSKLAGRGDFYGHLGVIGATVATSGGSNPAESISSLSRALTTDV